MSSLHFRQSVVALIRIAGHQPADVTSPGGNRHPGSHLTATFGSQLMVTMFDLDGAMQYVNAWTAEEHRWVFGYLPAEVPGAKPADLVSAEPSLSIRTHGIDKIDTRYDFTARAAIVRAGALTWIFQDRAAADSMITAWEYVAQIAPAVLDTSVPCAAAGAAEHPAIPRQGCPHRSAGREAVHNGRR